MDRDTEVVVRANQAWAAAVSLCYCANYFDNTDKMLQIEKTQPNTETLQECVH